MKIIRFICFLFLACAPLEAAKWVSPDYRNLYVHLERQKRIKRTAYMTESDYFVIILVDARHLDYTDNQAFFRTLAKHPSDGSKNGDVGHAWVYLRGLEKGKVEIVEGGHTGEFGEVQPKYFEGVMNAIEYGKAIPDMVDIWCPMEFDPNPISYLWEVQKDGLFQQGSGGHVPTFAAKIGLTEEQYCKIKEFIAAYPFKDYSLSQNQCASFAARIAHLAGLPLESEISMRIAPFVTIGKRKLTFWNDHKYSLFTFSTPDMLEKSLMQAVLEGKAEYALNWYNYQHPRSFKEKIAGLKESLLRMNERLERMMAL